MLGVVDAIFGEIYHVEYPQFIHHPYRHNHHVHLHVYV